MSPKCECTMAISLNGEGCRYCQPQNYIDHQDEIIAELAAVEAKLAWAREVWQRRSPTMGLSGLDEAKIDYILSTAEPLAVVKGYMAKAGMWYQDGDTTVLDIADKEIGDNTIPVTVTIQRSK